MGTLGAWDLQGCSEGLLLIRGHSLYADIRESIGFRSASARLRARPSDGKPAAGRSWLAATGLLEVTGDRITFSPQTGKDDSPSYYAYSFPRALREQYFKEWHAQNDPKIGMAPMTEVISYSGPDYDDIRPHLWNFFEAVRTRKPVVEDHIFGHNAALACHMANESYFRHSALALTDVLPAAARVTGNR